MKICPICKTEFELKTGKNYNRRKIYCSPACSHKSYFYKNREKLNEYKKIYSYNKRHGLPTEGAYKQVFMKDPQRKFTKCSQCTAELSSNLSRFCTDLCQQSFYGRIKKDIADKVKRKSKKVEVKTIKDYAKESGEIHKRKLEELGENYYNRR